MLEEQTTLTLEDQSKNNNIECEIEPKKEVVKLKLGDKTSYIKMDDIYALALLILTPDKRDLLLPVRQTKITKYMRQHRVKVKNDIKKGQEMVVNCEIDVPTITENSIKAFLNPNKILI